MERSDLIYLAGIFDGEGNIDIAHSKPSSTRREQYSLNVAFQQKLPLIPNYLVSLFGGSIYRPRSRAYFWHIHGAKAASFLRELLPYLRLKKHEAEVALKFQALVGQMFSIPLQQKQRVYDEFRGLKHKS